MSCLCILRTVGQHSLMRNAHKWTWFPFFDVEIFALIPAEGKNCFWSFHRQRVYFSIQRCWKKKLLFLFCVTCKVNSAKTLGRCQKGFLHRYTLLRRKQAAAQHLIRNRRPIMLQIPAYEGAEVWKKINDLRVKAIEQHCACVVYDHVAVCLDVHTNP
jgi:hypothetical protein